MSQQGGPRWRCSTGMLTVCTSSVIDVTLWDSLLHAHGTRIKSLSMLETTQENLCVRAGRIVDMGVDFPASRSHGANMYCISTVIWYV